MSNISEETLMKQQLEADFDDELFRNEFTNDFFSQAIDNDTTGTPPSAEHLQVLQKCFGHKQFRPLQWKIISSIINFKRDNCAIMTTGYGKSLCFQYPSAYVGGVTLVVSPLISLMQDQVLSLKMSNVPACFLGSAQKNQKQVLDDILADKYSIIYLTPEFCSGDLGQDFLSKMYNQLSITLIAIDEAHCVSSWGHDFRFSYRQLGKLRTAMPDVPILATTATATPKVQQDIVNILKLRDPQVSYSGFDRPNLYFAVYSKGAGVFEDLKKIMFRDGSRWKFNGPTIIYCISRKATEELAEVVNSWDIKCLPYHAGLSLPARTDAHEQFMKDKIQVIVATIAFGMGIDKPDIRNVIHYGSSGSLEGYYQEVGRAGRDGLPSICTTFFSNADFNTHSILNSNSSGGAKRKQQNSNMLSVMRNYLYTRDCRRMFILNHFEDKNVRNVQNSKCCDNCKNKDKDRPDKDVYEGLDENGNYDFTNDVVAYISAVNAMHGSYGFGAYDQFLVGSKIKKFERYHNNPLFGSGKDKKKEWWNEIGHFLLNQKFLTEKSVGGAFNYSVYSVSQQGNNFCKKAKNGTTQLLMVPPASLLKHMKMKPRTGSEWLSAGNYDRPVGKIPEKKEEKIDSFEEAERKRLLRLLRNKRHELSLSNDCMPYMIAPDIALMDIAKHKPTDINMLREIKAEGLTEAKIQKFGADFVNTIIKACNISQPKTSTKASIEDLLAKYPISKLNSSAQASYALFKTGLSVSKIAEKRGMVEGTITQHLAKAMLCGCPIKLADLGLSNTTRDTIINAINSMGNNTYSLKAIKEACPEHIQYREIEYVVNYLKVRAHLKSIGVPYEEFEDFSYNEKTETKKDIGQLLQVCDEIMDADGLNSGDDDDLMMACDAVEAGLESNELKMKDCTSDNDESNDTIIYSVDDDDGPSTSKLNNNTKKVNEGYDSDDSISEYLDDGPPSKKCKEDGPKIKYFGSIVSPTPESKQNIASVNGSEEKPKTNMDSNVSGEKRSTAREKKFKKALPPWLALKR